MPRSPKAVAGSAGTPGAPDVFPPSLWPLFPRVQLVGCLGQKAWEFRVDHMWRCGVRACLPPSAPTHPVPISKPSLHSDGSWSWEFLEGHLDWGAQRDRASMMGSVPLSEGPGSLGLAFSPPSGSTAVRSVNQEVPPHPQSPNLLSS